MSDEWVYQQTEEELWTVGYYDGDGEWRAGTDHGSPEEARAEVHYLNGGLSGAVTTTLVTSVLTAHLGDKPADLADAFATALAELDPDFDPARFRETVLARVTTTGTAGATRETVRRCEKASSRGATSAQEPVTCDTPLTERDECENAGSHVDL